jgi:hypothetical protein
MLLAAGSKLYGREQPRIFTPPLQDSPPRPLPITVGEACYTHCRGMLR